MSLVTTAYHTSDPLSPRGRQRTLPKGWPLTALYLFFPVWWLLGLSHFVFLFVAAAMAGELLRRRPVFAPMSFGLWLLFLLVVVAGGALLWVQPTGTIPVQGLGKLIPYTYRSLWYLAITVVCLYIVNMSEEDLPTERVTRLLGWMFVYTTAGGLVGLSFPHVDFPSALELLVHTRKEGFIYSLIHPTIVSASDFLGYDQPRPTAPFAYANAWGNNLGLFMPFFIGSWLMRGPPWRRVVSAGILAASIIPIAYSLNRGLWIGLAVGLTLVAVRSAMLGNTRILQATLGLVVVGAIVFVSSPLYDTVLLRINTPESDARRGTVASDVISKTVEGSPLLGFGDTRQITGSFNSIAGGETPDCHQCAAPTLGTQGYMWRLIFTTGLIGTVLFLSFMAAQLIRFLGGRDPVALIGCAAILMGLVFSFVYDSLESPLFTIFVGIGLMNRRFVRPGQLADAARPPRATGTRRQPEALRTARARTRGWWERARIWLRE